MALSTEDKHEVRLIVREELTPLHTIYSSLERKMDAMMELLAPLMYVRHDLPRLQARMDRAEAEITEVKRLQA